MTKGYIMILRILSANPILIPIWIPTLLPKIDYSKDLLCRALLLVLIHKRFSGNESSDKVKVVQGYGSSSSTADVPFGVIEEVPAFAGCEGLKTNEERKACTSDKIREFVAGNFDTKIGKDFLKEGDLVRVIVQFKIDETGNIRDIRARAPVPELEEEAKRVVNSLPQMTPGKQRGKAVGVVYSLPISFTNG